MLTLLGATLAYAAAPAFSCPKGCCGQGECTVKCTEHCQKNDGKCCGSATACACPTGCHVDGKCASGCGNKCAAPSAEGCCSGMSKCLKN